MVTAYVGLGSNLRDPREQVERALRALRELPRTELISRSRLYRTRPWGGIAQPDFINAIAQLATDLSSAELMHALLGIEREFGRTRDGERFGPRVIDLDLLLYGDEFVDEPGLHVPHPRLHERAFVLVPLAEIAPTLAVPGQGRVDALLARIDAADRLVSVTDSDFAP